MSKSKLEERLYGDMHLLSLTEHGFSMPVREFHPFWCCEHTKRAHGPTGWYCHQCYVDNEPNVGPGHVCYHEYRKERGWRCDFVWPDRRLIVEVEGGIYTQGRHTRGSGFEQDLGKYNALTEAGWTVYRVGRRDVITGKALRIIERALKQEAIG